MKENPLRHENLTWAQCSEDADHPFPVSYWGTILDFDDMGHISVLYCWDLEHFCHFNRHLCATTSLVLEGELHVKTFENGELVDTTIRRVRDYAKKPPGNMHMEQGGPDGALALFELYAPDGQLTEQLDKKGTHCAPWQPISCDAFSKNSGQQPENADATDSRAIVGRRRPLISMTQGGPG